MIIKHDDNGWAFDESENWKLVHNGTEVIFFEHTDKSISTQDTLYVGTEQECRDEIARLGLPLPDTQQEEEAQ
jgi:phage replication-related protein YjqB (UPF0714/DUF867 family)